MTRGWPKGKRHSEETKQKISAGKKGKRHSEGNQAEDLGREEGSLPLAERAV